MGKIKMETSEIGNSTTRFSDRVGNYIKYRPSYPSGVLELLREQCGLGDASVVGDFGSGTGILTRLFLENGNIVFGVEPNGDMREAAERLLCGYDCFRSVGATAENSTLEADSIDLAVAGQAFHWFDARKSRSEFSRVLRPGGWVVLIWNERRVGSTAFLEDYEAFLKRHATDYESVNHMNIGKEEIADFFSPGSFELESFPNEQRFDWDGLKGRCLSSSYMPNAGDPGYESMISELREVFGKRQEGDCVTIEYDTTVYYGQFGRL